MFGGSPFGRTRSAPDPNGPEDGADVQIRLNVTFKESLFGVVKEFDRPEAVLSLQWHRNVHASKWPHDDADYMSILPWPRIHELKSMQHMWWQQKNIKEEAHKSEDSTWCA